MNITIFGSGYVGLVTAACFADAGNDVLCVDVDAAKVERLRRGECPIYEPGLETLLVDNAWAGRLRFNARTVGAAAIGGALQPDLASGLASVGLVTATP